MAELYLDNDVSLELAPLLRRTGHRVTTTRDLGLFRATDDAQLLTATRNHWTVVTYNRRDFTMLHDAWLNWPVAFGVALPPHSGITVVDPGLPPVLAAQIANLLRSTPVETLPNALIWWHHRDAWQRRIIGTGWEPFP